MSDKCCKFNRDRVNSFLEVGRCDVLCNIFAWGTPNKCKTIPLDQYLANLPPNSTANFPQLSNKQKNFKTPELQQIQSDTTCTKFDISFLITAIKLACENVANCNDQSVWMASNPTMEGYITAIKVERNNSMHGARAITTQEFLDIADRLRKHFHDALDAAKIKYNRSDTEIDDKVKRMNDKLDKIMTEVLGEKDLLAFIIPQLKQDLIEETNKALEIIFKNSLNIDPMSFLTDTKLHLQVQKVFTEVTITQRRAGVGRGLRYQNLVEVPRSGPGPAQPQVLLVEGIAGSGKTTFITLVTDEWLKDATDRTITGLDYYDLLLRVQCRERKTTSLNCLLENELSDVFLKFRSLVPPLIKKCKILILVDGLDETNEDSEKLIDDILTQMKTVNGCTLIFTSRPEGVTSFISKLPQEYQISCVKLIGIPEAYRADFVRRYYEEITHQIGSAQNTEKLLENIQVLEKEHFRLPLNMVFLTWIYIHDPLAITFTTTQTQLYHNTYKLCLQKLLDRLARHTTTRNSNQQTLENHLNQPMRTVQYESLLALWRSQLTFEDEAIDRIRDSCTKHNIPPEELLSAFLTLKTKSTYLGYVKQYSVPHKGLQDFYAAIYIATHHKLKTSSVGVRGVLQETIGKLDEKLGRLQNMLCHVVGLLPNTVLHTTIEEVVDMLFESGMDEREKWLDLVEDTKANPVVLRRVAPYFAASICERQILEQLEEKLLWQDEEEEEQQGQEEERKNKEEEEEKEVEEEEDEEKTGEEDMGKMYVEEKEEKDKNVEKDKEEDKKKIKKRNEEKDMEKRKEEEQLKMKEENDNGKEDGKKRKTKTMGKKYSDTDDSIPPCLEEITPVLITNIRIECLIALLPLLPSCKVQIEFEKDPGLHMQNLMNVMIRHLCITVTLMPHFKDPDPTVTSDHLLQQVLPRSQLGGFIGKLTENSIHLLPPSLHTLSLALTDDDHSAQILEALHFHRLPSLCDFRIHVPVAKVTSSSLIPVLIGGNNETVKIFLFLSGVNDQLIEEACRVAKALQYPAGYKAIMFPQSSASNSGWRKLLEGLAETGITVQDIVLVTDNNGTKEIDVELQTLARAKLGCEFGRADDQDLWLY